MDGYVIGLAIGVGAGIAIGVSIGISIGKKQKPWSEMSEGEKKVRFGIIAALSVLYLSVNLGVLFSKKAFIPSFWSLLLKQLAKHSASQSIPSFILLL